MEEVPVSDNSPGRREVAVARTEAPAMPRPSRNTLWRDTPHLIVSNGQRYGLGWMDTKKEGPRFVVARIGVMGAKVLDRFPLTADGWAQAWAALLKLHAGAAQAVAERLQELLAIAATEQGEPKHRAAEMPEPSQEAAAAGERKPWRELSKEEKRDRREERRAMSPQERREQFKELQEAALQKRMLTKGVAFPGLGVRIRGGQVYPWPTLSQPALGPLEGARAELTDPTKAQMVRAGVTSGLALGTLIGPLALAPGLLRKSKAVAFVVCANGKIHEKKLDGTTAIRSAQSDAVKFNALAGPRDQPVTAPTQLPSPTAGERLAEVTRLHDEGLLTDEEFQAKRAEIISQL